MKSCFFKISLLLSFIAVSLFVFSQKGDDKQSRHASKYLEIKNPNIKAAQDFVLHYSGLPGNKQDWITLVERDKPDNTFGQWFYTQGKKAGTYTFKGVPEGMYEIRVYFNWPDGQYKVMDRLVINVGGSFNLGNSGYFKYEQSGYAANQTITIEYLNLPGNKQDWITLVEKNKPDNTFGQWFYTQGKKSGVHEFNGVPAGTYELRLYFNWPDGKYEVKGRETIIVK